MTGGNGVEVYDVNTAAPKLVKTIRTGAAAHAFRSMGDKRHMLVSNRVVNTISKIDFQALALVDQFVAPGGLDCMNLSANGRYIHVAARWSKRLTVADTTTHEVVRQVVVGKSPCGVWTLNHAPR